MLKKCTLFAIALLLSFASFGTGTLVPVPGYPGLTALGCCVGGDGWVGGDSTTGTVTWTSSNPAVATVSGTSYYATVHGVSAGTTILSYVSATSVLTGVFTVTAAPAAIIGPSTTCLGVPTSLSCSPSGGTWSMYPTSYGTVTSSGVATLLTSSSATVFYCVGPGCYANYYLSSTGPWVSDITGPSFVCIGSTIALADAATGGTWSSSMPSVATISSAGVVTGVSSGTTIISYGITGSSCTSYKYDTISVAPLSAGTISGTLSLFIGATTSLSASMSGGTWSSSATSVATIGSTGVVTGLAAGTSTITYTVAGCSGPIYTTAVVTVTPLDGISGHVIFSTPYSGVIKIWLIKYNPSTLILSAVDSQIIYPGGTNPYYQFTGLATDSFRVKVATLTPSGFVPTYHTSSFYWNSATVIHHVSGSSDVNKDINMIAGATPTGPGFIGGNVTTGANKGTAGGVPVAGLNVFLVDAATNAVVQYVTTNASGAYSFSSLPLNTYYVFPDSLNYATIPYTGIALTSASPSKTAADFTQHTVSKIISPHTSGVSNLNSQANIAIYPNPTSGKLNIGWQSMTNEAATVVITDVAGSVVYRSAIQLTAGAGNKQIELPALSNGLYLVHLKSANLDHIGKLMIER